MWETIGLSVVLFASTDVDDLFVLILFFADPRLRAPVVVVGQYLGMAALFALSLALALTAHVIPAPYLGWLGLAPIAIGVKKLWDGDDDAPPEGAPSGGGALAVALTTIANGGDNLAVYTPFLATLDRYAIAATAAAFAVMTGVWLVFAHALVRHAGARAGVRWVGRWAVPAALVGLGLSILYRSGAAGLP